MQPLRVCIVSSEVAPLAKTGGLADVSAALAGELHRRGHDVRLVMPLYRRMREAGRPFRDVPGLIDREMSFGPRRGRWSVRATPLPGKDLDVLCVDVPELYDRDGIYTQDDDEHLRFGLLSRVCLALCQESGWAPDILHLNDWHVGPAALYLRLLASWDTLFAKTRSVLTIHNIGYQGVFASDVVHDLGLDDAVHKLHQEDLAAGRVNFLKTGILYADALTTVSRTYAREIQTEEYGMGLDGMLRKRADRLVGIVNGIDDEIWNPSVDPHIARKFSLDTLDDKRFDRAALLSDLGLAPDPKGPVLGIVSRLVAQKGFDLLFDVLPEMLPFHDVRLAVLGSGEPKLEEFFAGLQARFPGKVCFYRGYNDPLSHRIEAGADAFLMPSRYEPCGLNQMYSLAYGTIPVVRNTGGLADTVTLFDRRTGEGTGVVFDHSEPGAMRWALLYLLELWGDRDAWTRMQRNAMAQDWSWRKQTGLYEALYRKLLEMPVASH
ncbi:MAG: glycogen synthase GlgA [Planctomycetes bacterium]|nr:glycogen synthase GlgA [Planctomycetota bacterium]